MNKRLSKKLVRQVIGEVGISRHIRDWESRFSKITGYYLAQNNMFTWFYIEELGTFVLWNRDLGPEYTKALESLTSGTPVILTHTEIMAENDPATFLTNAQLRDYFETL